MQGLLWMQIPAPAGVARLTCVLENQETLVPGWPVNLVGGGGVGGGGGGRGGEGSRSFFLRSPSLCLVRVGRRRAAWR